MKHNGTVCAPPNSKEAPRVSEDLRAVQPAVVRGVQISILSTFVDKSRLKRLHSMSARIALIIALIVRDVVARVGAPPRRLSCEGRSLRPVTEAECAPLSEEEILALHSCDHESLRVGDLCEGDGDDLRVP